MYCRICFISEVLMSVFCRATVRQCHYLYLLLLRPKLIEDKSVDPKYFSSSLC